MNDVALILGGAACLWADVDAALALVGLPPSTTDWAGWPGIVIATNDAGAAWPGRLHHWVTLHPEKLTAWKDLRRARGYPEGYATWSKFAHPAIQHLVTSWGSGTSGLLAVAVARAVKARRAVLCGVPMEATPHFFDTDVWRNADNAWRGWVANERRMTGWVRSMSGRTRGLLGEPTPEWLEGRGA